MLPLPLQFVIAMIASAINERLQRKLDYALEEVRVLKENLRLVANSFGSRLVRRMTTAPLARLFVAHASEAC
jgi:hypothetical protein